MVRGPLPLDQARVPARAARAVARGDPPHRAPRGAERARACSSGSTPRGSTACPGGGAEILVDRVRRQDREGQVHERRVARRHARRAPHGAALERDDDVRHRRHRRATASAHLVKIRDLQDETGGLHGVLLLGLPARAAARGSSRATAGRVLYLRQQAVARILLDNVDHVGASWVTQGPEVGQVALRFGADDFGSVMFEENVVSSAGTTFCMNADGDGAAHPRRGLQGRAAQRALRLAHAARVSHGDARRPCRRASSPGDAAPIARRGGRGRSRRRRGRRRARRRTCSRRHAGATRRARARRRASRVS